MRLLPLAAALIGLALPAAPAAAQGFAVDVEAGWLEMTSARESAEAVFGSPGGAVFGGGVGYATDMGLFFRAGIRYAKREGERVFALEDGGGVFPLGHPLEVRLLPVFGTVGYRFGALGPATPYLGAGAGVTSYREESTVAGVTESLSRSGFSWRVLGGVELLRGPVRLAAELSWSSAPDLLGLGGVSELFGETDPGGLSVVGKVVFVP